MSGAAPVEFIRRRSCDRLGLKGPRAADWLSARGIALPAAPNTWCSAASSAGVEANSFAALLTARLGASEFFVEDGDGASRVRGLGLLPEDPPAGVYPVLREDAAFVLWGAGAADVLAQVCSINFADLDLAVQPVLMTLMIGVAVMVVPERILHRARYRLWCDPTFGSYLEESVGKVVIECGGSHRGVSV